ncbi:SH3 domain-binding protein 2 [Anolis carolinensis]|uniref:SH3 domain-binding protein 2 n=1 Tax=Anolis carolinensis TaxID=28377 RepID=UPI002F2B156F
MAGRAQRTMTSEEETFWSVPMKAIGSQNLLTMPGGVTKSGYLHKKGGTQFQLLKWPLRFVIIHKGCVYYFKSSTSSSPQGAFSLKGYNRVMRAAEETTSNNVFPFKLVHISKKHRTWFFSASSEDERKDWMASLRREIDLYHEKKEAVPDLSDSGSDADSFYGSVERPVNIHYSQHSIENSDYDQDEDDDEYLQPDDLDCAKCEDQKVFPPKYPPPPVPQMERTSYSHTKASSLSGKSRVAVFPPPPLKNSSPHVRPSILLGVKGEFPFNYQAEHKKGTNSTCQQASGQGPPVPPVHLPPKPILFTEIRSAPAVCQPQTNVLPATKEYEKLKELKLSTKAPPPLPSSKPKLSQNAMHIQEPRKPDHPGILISKVLSNSQVSRDKSSVPVSKPEKPFTPQRSSPDGQSFRNSSFEKPVSPSKSKLSGEDSDDDYEKVELPSSVFVNTCESLEVERLFKSENSTGHLKDGLFCIRNSSTKTGKVLVVWDGSIEKVRNYRIFQQGCKFYLEADALFMSLGNLIEHYCSHVLPGHVSLILRFPYGYSGPR